MPITEVNHSMRYNDLIATIFLFWKHDISLLLVYGTVRYSSFYRGSAAFFALRLFAGSNPGFWFLFSNNLLLFFRLDGLLEQPDHFGAIVIELV